MNSKWIDEYRRFSGKMKFLSKLIAFLIFVFSIISLSVTIRGLIYEPEMLINAIEFSIPSIFFHIIVTIVFSIRFSLYFTDSRRMFNLSQVLWIIGYLTILTYAIYSYYWYLRLSMGIFASGNSIDLIWRIRYWVCFVGVI